MKTIKGPGLFLAQYLSQAPQSSTLDGICAWAASLGFRAVQIPTLDTSIFDLVKAAESATYAQEIEGIVHSHGLVISELSTHLQGQLLAVHPAYESLFDSFAPLALRGRPAARTQWAADQLCLAARASARLGLRAHVTFSGALAWPYLYPWPQRPPGLVEAAFSELGSRWRPILDAFDASGVDVCYEIHPGEDLHDGISYEMFLEEVGQHPRANLLYDPSHFVLQQLDYLQYIDFYHERIKAFHVKDAEFRPTGKQGVYGGYQPWLQRAGRFRSPGDGQIDFGAVFSKLAAHDYDGWAVLEWECALEDAQEGARKGARFIADHIIKVSDRAFDDFAGAGLASARVKALLGLPVASEKASR
jgi:sugar phosphate isomerase/epimerase